MNNALYCFQRWSSANMIPSGSLKVSFSYSVWLLLPTGKKTKTCFLIPTIEKNNDLPRGLKTILTLRI